MQQEDIIENTLAEPVLAYRHGQKNNDPYFFDPLDDVGFKRLFASQQNADLIICFINQVLKGNRQMVSLEVLKNEYPGETHEEGGATIDMVCKDQDGTFFLVEMQRQYQKNFKERSLFYASRLITEQAPRGNRRAWAYALRDVYVISLLEEFTVSSEKNDSWQHDVSLINTCTGKVFSKRLAFTYIELSSFNKSENELESNLEQWIYALKNLKHLSQMPAIFTDPKLMEFCEAARYMNLTKTEKNMISAKTKQRWDYYSVLETAKE
ncbi:MAG TPA: Rpn family recombination-promoting nuclease/putative transposase, partial [Pedobacter sp.]|uniref:Rpn family recombination-promoting nuclease/putative transposase n=1 Tax=Pedobacter sp. TaxID=1411316 RepID=UPI002B6E2694